MTVSILRNAVVCSTPFLMSFTIPRCSITYSRVSSPLAKATCIGLVRPVATLTVVRVCARAERVHASAKVKAIIARGFTVTIMSPILAASNTNQEQFQIDGVLRAESARKQAIFAHSRRGKTISRLRGEGRGLVLRSPDGTESDVVDDAAGRAADAPRRAAVVGVEVPAAAAQQTERPSRGSCGVGHAC